MKVVWLTFHDGPARGYWDQGLLERIYADADHHEGAEHVTAGCTVIVPGRFNAEHVDRVRDVVSWGCRLIITSDEESLFPWQELRHPRLWVMTPRPDANGARFLGEGYAPDTPELVAACKWEADTRPIDVYFAGQVTHQRRAECVDAASRLPQEVVLRPTEGFQQGMDRPEYLRLMAASKVALCPSGPATVDSFRLFEALEAHCVPIADDRTPNPDYPRGYWHTVFPGHPFPVVADWNDAWKDVEVAVGDWPHTANRCAAWWIRYKRDLARELNPQTGPTTVLMPTSPIPSHPSTAVIEQTVASVRHHLPDAEIVVMIDGVRPEQADRSDDYAEYVRRLLWLADHEWANVTPLLFDDHRHQVAMTREALELVDTSTVLFVEHDTPLWPDPIPWPACVEALDTGAVDLIRFHHESRVLPDHEHMMLDTEPRDVCGVPLLRTVQWSQRPHLAATAFYRSILAAHFTPDCRTMIEDVMHGVVHSAYLDRGLVGWQQFRLAMFAPDGSIERSYHLDGRGEDPKFEMVP